MILQKRQLAVMASVMESIGHKTGQPEAVHGLTIAIF